MIVYVLLLAFFLSCHEVKSGNGAGYRYRYLYKVPGTCTGGYELRSSTFVDTLIPLR
jgi:hypothetical protein